MSPFEPDRNTSEVLLEKARDLLVREGFTAFSLRKVASAAGISAAAIYRHYEDKDALLSAVVRRGSLLFTEYLTEALREKTPLERLRRMGQRYFDFALENPAEYELLFVVNCASHGFDKLDEQTRVDSRGSFQLLVDRIAECQRSGDVAPGDPVPLAVFIWSGVHGVISLAQSGHLSVPEGQLTGLLTFHRNLLIRAILIDPETAAR